MSKYTKICRIKFQKFLKKYIWEKLYILESSKVQGLVKFQESYKMNLGFLEIPKIIYIRKSVPFRKLKSLWLFHFILLAFEIKIKSGKKILDIDYAFRAS